MRTQRAKEQNIILRPELVAPGGLLPLNECDDDVPNSATDRFEPVRRCVTQMRGEGGMQSRPDRAKQSLLRVCLNVPS